MTISDAVGVLNFTAPVALAALGETVVQLSGVINIGLEGVILTSAYAAAMTSLATGNAWIGVAAGVIFGVATALVFGVATVVFAADQVVTGTAVNLIALGVTDTLYRDRFGQSGALLSISGLHSILGLQPMVWLLLLGIPVTWLLLFRTGWGLAVRAAGESTKSADAAGLKVVSLRLQALTFGGALGGLAGAHLSIGIADSFSENMSAGRGFVAIAMVTFGRWKPQWVVAASLLVGTAEALQFLVQTYGWDIPYQLLIAAPYTVALLALMMIGKRSISPAELARPYRREG